jgi:hypothetical protein
VRAIMLVAGVLMATPSSRAEQLVFYTASLPDATSIELSIVSDKIARAADYDFDVAIGLTSTDASGAVQYVDHGRHHARIRCTQPAYVSFGAHRYAMDAIGQGMARGDWKAALWKAFCAVPSS